MTKTTAIAIQNMLHDLCDRISSKQEIHTRDEDGVPLTHRSMMTVEDIECRINDIIERVAREAKTDEDREADEILAEQERNYLGGLGL